MTIADICAHLPQAVSGPHEDDELFATSEDCVDFLLKAMCTILAHTGIHSKTLVERLTSQVLEREQAARNPGTFHMFQRFLKNQHPGVYAGPRGTAQLTYSPDCKERRLFDDLFGAQRKYTSTQASAMQAKFKAAVPSDEARWRILLKHELNWPNGGGPETVASREKTFNDVFSHCRTWVRTRVLPPPALVLRPPARR